MTRSEGQQPVLSALGAPPHDLAAHSRFVQRLRRRYTREFSALPPGAPTRETFTHALQTLRGQGLDLASALRVLRQLTLERLAALDCEQSAPLDTITRAMTWLAEVTLDAAYTQVQVDLKDPVSYTHLTLPTICSV